MLKWGLPKDGVCRNLHVFHPDWCSFSDRFKGTVHYHGGWIRGTVLLGAMEHTTYDATPHPDGDRLYEGTPQRLVKHTTTHGAGATYELPAMVAHWIVPTELTLTYFEEEDTERMGDLLEPLDADHDEHTWTQAQADALLPVLLEMIDERLKRLAVVA